MLEHGRTEVEGDEPRLCLQVRCGRCQRPKKDLGAIAMATTTSVALGANPMQAFKEAESSNDVLLIITYCPCNDQGVVLANSI